MYFLTQELEFCYGHRLIHYSGKCRFLHGHNGRVEVVLGGTRLDERGMLTDFGEIKRVLRTWIDTELDHKMLLHREDPLLPLLRDAGQQLFVMDANPTAENIARLIFDRGQAEGLPMVEVRFWETSRSSATYTAAGTIRQSGTPCEG
ncbi:MAG: 6-pyruvoyl trahydropterin synthase family protein [Planctomycetaceae bacterium]